MSGLRDFTLARVGLRRAGNALATGELLDFQLAHAMARDAVHASFDAAALLGEIRSRGWQGVVVASAVKDRAEYLKRPDLGRQLSDASRAELDVAGKDTSVVVVIADGLSALAVDRHALALLDRMRLGADVPIVVAQQARVALGDEIGERLRASLALMLIGERPGLSSPDSLGAYLTWAPRVGRTDAERYCVSNIRAEGLSYDQAAARLLFLMQQANAANMTGTGLRAIKER
jgi:ethanolamine ammonia-lyase small subunit